MSTELAVAGAAWVLPLTFALQGISAALILARLVRGPRAVDRVVAIDALSRSRNGWSWSSACGRRPGASCASR